MHPRFPEALPGGVPLWKEGQRAGEAPAQADMPSTGPALGETPLPGWCPRTSGSR